MKRSLFMMLSCAILSACFSISAPVSAADQDTTGADLLSKLRHTQKERFLLG